MDRDSSSHTTLRVTGFEPDVFRQLMEFAHTGRVDLMPRTIIGVISSADYYQFLGRQTTDKTFSSILSTLFCRPKGRRPPVLPNVP